MCFEKTYLSSSFYLTRWSYGRDLSHCHPESRGRFYASSTLPIPRRDTNSESFLYTAIQDECVPLERRTPCDMKRPRVGY